MSINQRALDRARERVWLIRDSERTTRHLKERNLMSRRKTAAGDSVDRPQSTSGTRARLDDLYQSAAGALDNVMEASKREAAIDATETVDPGRFPVLGRDGHA